MGIISLCELGHLKTSDYFYYVSSIFKIIIDQEILTLRAHAFSTGPSCTSWSSVSPMFNFVEFSFGTLNFSEVMGGYYFITNTIVVVNKHRITVIIKSSKIQLTNILFWIIWSSSEGIQGHWWQRILELQQQFHLDAKLKSQDNEDNARKIVTLTIPKANCNRESW